MVLIEFALIYGNDHFVIPVDLDVGSVCQIRSLVVTDSFGERTLVRSARDVDGPPEPGRCSSSRRIGAMGRQRQPPTSSWSCPALGQSLRGDEIEDVLLIRDEMANMAWAVERSVEGAAGVPVDRFEAWQERRRREEQAAEAAAPGSTAPKSGGLEYRISSRFPSTGSRCSRGRRHNRRSIPPR